MPSLEVVSKDKVVGRSPLHMCGQAGASQGSLTCEVLWKQLFQSTFILGGWHSSLFMCVGEQKQARGTCLASKY